MVGEVPKKVPVVHDREELGADVRERGQVRVGAAVVPHIVDRGVVPAVKRHRGVLQLVAACARPALGDAVVQVVYEVGAPVPAAAAPQVGVLVVVRGERERGRGLPPLGHAVVQKVIVVGGIIISKGTLQIRIMGSIVG